MKTGRQLSRFLVVGATTVLVDFAGYSALLALGLAVDPAKAAGFVAGTVFAWFANRLWTFSAAGGARRFARFAALYGVTLALNVLVNGAVHTALGGGEIAVIAAFPVATAISASANFFGMKYLVFEA